MKNFLKSTSGSVLPSFAILLVPLMVAGGAALDYANLSNERTHLQNAGDAAAIAAAKKITVLSDNELEQLIDEYLAANLTPRQYGYIDDQDIVIDRNNSSVAVRVAAKRPATLLKVAGYENLNYSTVSAVNGPRGSVEIALVLDNTGSMGWPAGENPHPTRMESLKESATDFIKEQLEQNRFGDRVKIGIVPFARYVNVGLENRGADWLKNSSFSNQWSGCVGSRAYPLNLQDKNYNVRVPTIKFSDFPGNKKCPAAITPLTASEETLLDAIDAMEPDDVTYIPGGLVWGERLVSASAPFDEGGLYENMERDNVKKVVIMMSDGDNTVRVNGQYHNGTNNPAQANGAMIEACDSIKDNGILLFTIGFGDGIKPATRQLLEDCSTNGENYANAADSAALEATFAKISQELGKLYLSF